MSTPAARRPERWIAYLIILIGIAGSAYALLNGAFSLEVGSTTLSATRDEVLVMGIIWLVIGVLLLLVMTLRRPAAAAAPTAPAAKQPGPMAKPSPHVAQAGTQGSARLATTPPPAQAAAVPPPVSNTPAVKPDNLEIIEGIGPKVKEALHNAGIFTFGQLARLTGADLVRIVREQQGVRIVGDASSWPKQAQYIVDGDMAGFEAYKRQLTVGRE